MQTEQRTWMNGQTEASPMGKDADLVLAFGGTELMADPKLAQRLRAMYPNAHLLGASTAGEILDTHVTDNTLVSTAIHFDATKVRAAEVEMAACHDASDAGARLAAALAGQDLVHVFVVSDGQSVNGTELVHGLRSKLPPGVAVTGGLAGDGSRFAHTFVMCDGEGHEGRVAAIGLYSKTLHVGYGSLGGWDPFGPQRVITRSQGNILYELDDQPALALYKRYLGDHAQDLPAAGLLFPLSVTSNDGAPHELVRTILGVNEKDQSLTFAGDVPVGAHARLMKANFDRLIAGAHGAAQDSHDLSRGHEPELAILVSCVGRKLVLKQRTEQELEAVREAIGPRAAMTGFYSYGEICPSAPQANCELHNQTMTVTTFSEA